MPRLAHRGHALRRPRLCGAAVAMAALLPAVVVAEAPVPAPGEAVAAASGPLRAVVTVETLSSGPDTGGPEGRQFVPAGRIGAGDEVYYTIRVTNPGREPVRGVIVTKRLPFGLTYVSGSAVGPAATVHFSIDSGETFAAASSLEVASPGLPTRPAVPADYTHVRWLLKRPLAGGATALLRFRATLG